MRELVEPGQRKRIRLVGWPAYAAATGLVGVAFALRLALESSLRGVQPFAFFYLSVLFAAWWGGVGPAAFAAVLGAMLAAIFFLPAGMAPSVIPLFVYASVCVCMVVLVRHARRSEAEAKRTAAELRADIAARTVAEEQVRASEEHLRGVLDNLLAFVGVLTPDGVLAHVNRLPVELAGVSSAEVEGQRIWDTYWWSHDPEPQALVRDGVERAARGELVRFDARIRMAGDTRMWIDVQLAPLRDAAGRITHLIASATDVTARRRAEEALRESERQVRLLLDSTAEGIYGVDTAGRCTFVNQSCARLLGRATESFIGSEMHALIHHTRGDQTPYPQAECPILNVTRYGQPVHLPDELVWRADGTSVPVEMFAHPVMQGGRTVGAVVSLMDITERRRAQQALTESESRFLQAFADAPIGMVLTALDGTLTHVNAAYCAITGYSADELRRFGYRGLTHPEDLAPNDELVRQLVAGEIPAFFFEKRYIRRDGRPLWVRVSASLRKDAQGHPVQIVGLIEDIDERRRAEEELRRTTTLLAAISDTTGDVIYAKDREGRLTFANPATSVLVGRPQEEILGRTDAELLRDRAAALRVMENDQRIMASGVTEELEEIVPLPDGARRVWSSHKVPYRDPDGRIVGLLGVSRDITARKDAEAALAEAKNQLAAHATTLERTVAERTSALQESVRELEAFSYSLSHDMRAPLRAMRGFSQILQAEYADQLGVEGAMYLGKIARAAGRLDQLIQDVLSYSRIVREPIRPEPVDLDRLVHQLVDENPALHSPEADLVVLSPLATVLGHEAYLMQVLSNLVYNAVKFVAPGERPSVRVWTERVEGNVRIYVRDQGIGIAPEAQERIFGMFQRLHGGKAYEGTGIGLTIVRKAVERMGGSVGVVSEPSRGSTFWVDLAAPEGT